MSQKMCLVFLDLKPIGVDSAQSPCQCIGGVENVEMEKPCNHSFQSSASKHYLTEFANFKSLCLAIFFLWI